MDQNPTVPVSQNASKIIVDPRLVRDLPKQVAAALDPKNKWYTGEEVGHDPTLGECMLHLAEHDGSRVYRDQNPFGALLA